VTSAFGWRADPFTGRPSFHKGVDLQAAYGDPVPSAGDGRVVFAGSQHGYGQIVVVRHGDGTETRYAHLSRIDVADGETVAAGTVLGTVGQSGRATGPHLHLEVVDHGRQVDPGLAAGTVAAGLKEMRRVSITSEGAHHED
jgi:murein DD-endopeptidase MepM/ murein hydrolase activator NlpD